MGYSDQLAILDHFCSLNYGFFVQACQMLESGFVQTEFIDDDDVDDLSEANHSLTEVLAIPLKWHTINENFIRVVDDSILLAT